MKLEKSFLFLLMCNCNLALSLKYPHRLEKICMPSISHMHAENNIKYIVAYKNNFQILDNWIY